MSEYGETPIDEIQGDMRLLRDVVRDVRDKSASDAKRYIMDLREVFALEGHHVELLIAELGLIHA